MSEPNDSKEPEPVQVPEGPVMDVRAGEIEPLNEDSPIQGKDLAWNTDDGPTEIIVIEHSSEETPDKE